MGDRVWHGEEGKGTIHEIMAHRTARVAFDRGTLGIGFHFDSLLWLPPVWSDDGRCLWKMVDWGKWSMWIGEGGLVSIHKWTAKIEDGYLCWDKPLPEAILRAIALRGDKS